MMQMALESSEPSLDAGGLARPRPVRYALIGLTIVGFALPVAAYFWYIHEYAVNVIFEDQWHDVRLIGHAYSGTLSLGDLWAQHNENRVFFPNLIVLLLAYTTHFNVVFEEYLGGAMLVVATGLLIFAHKRRSPSIPYIAYCPVAFLMLSLVQGGGNTLWGFQVAWYLVFLSLAIALVLLDKPAFTWLALVGAIAAAVVGSFSLLQGLLIWPAGLVLLYLRDRPRGALFTWVIAAVVTGVTYLFPYSLAGTGASPSYVFSHIGTTLKFFFFAVGDVFGLQIRDAFNVLVPNPIYTAGDNTIIVVGFIIFAIAIWVLFTYGLRRDRSDGSPIGVALVCFGLLFAALTTVGRVTYFPNASQPRYTTFDLLILVGSYLAMLSRPTIQCEAGRPGRIAGPVAEGLGEPSLPSKSAAPWVRIGDLMARSVLIGVVVLQVILGTALGLKYGSYWKHRQIAVAEVLANTDKASDQLIASEQFPVGGFYGFIPPVWGDFRSLATFARVHHLSLFGTSSYTQYAKAGLSRSLATLHTELLRPLYGATLSGRSVIAVGVGSTTAVTTVNIYVAGDGQPNMLIGIGKRSPFGYLVSWNTDAVANGKYNLYSVARDDLGNSAKSADLAVNVHN